MHTPSIEGRQAGEGVISAAIVVLIMAVIGAGMWVAFNGVWNDQKATIESNTSQIGQTTTTEDSGGDGPIGGTTG